MKFSHFFIRRPIFAAVLSIIVFIVGLIAMFRLPISEYPEVVPPTIIVQAAYPGANPKTIARPPNGFGKGAGPSLMIARRGNI